MMQPDCTNRPGFLRRALAPLLLALCVLAGQAGVAMHGLGHALEGLSASASAPMQQGDDAGAVGCDDGKRERGSCPLHALFTELASMAVGAWPSFVAQGGVHEPAVFAHAPAFAAPRVAFRSRAPPVVPA